jgi:hypothetical protein
MSRNCQLFAGGNNGFKIKNVKGYLKWKETLGENLQGLLHEEKKDYGFFVYVGIRWENEELDDLDTYVNHFHPDGDGDGYDDGYPAQLWGGLSLFTEEPIELFQTDEEFPYLTKVFGFERDEGMYRLFAEKGNVTVQELGFKVVKTEQYKKEDLLEEEDLEYIEKQESQICDKCGSNIDYKFRFEQRGYYQEIKSKNKYEKICEKCYRELKKPFTEIRKLEAEIQNKQQKLQEMKK